MLLNIKTLQFTFINILMLAMPTSGLIHFKIPKTNIVHTKSGLILHYLSEYRPANRIITFTVTIPMVPDMCYLLPRNAMKKIPHCQPESAIMQKLAKERAIMYNDKVQTGKRSTTTSTSRMPLTTFTMRIPTAYIYPPTRRAKRGLPALITIGVGAVTTTILSAVNYFQSASLKNEIKLTQKSLQVMQQAEQSNHAQILHLQDGQLKVAHELNSTQVALNKTLALVNEHTHVLQTHENALRTIHSQAVFMSSRLASFVHAVETHFIHTSMEEILSNRLNLHFVHHQDLPQVVDRISQALNISFDEAESSIPMLTLLERLLVRQQIDFVPTITPESTPDGLLIGQLVFSSFFAAPSQDQAPFSIYELVSVPFNQNDKRRVRLAQMPAYLGIEHTSQQVIRWSKEEAAACDFVLVPSCRETPAKRKEAQDDCLYQILTDSKLDDCRTEPYTDAVFVRRVGQHWVISTIKNTTCHSVTTSDLDEHTIDNNELIILPPVALITTMNTSSLACDRFSLPGLPVQVGAPINLIYNKSVNPMNKDFLDLQAVLANETHWAKLPYIPPDMQVTIDFINNMPKPAPTSYFQGWTDHSISLTVIVIIGMSITLVIVLLYYIRMKKKAGTTHITIAIPSMKAMEPLQG
jgi:hypothetical protein